MVNSVDLFSRIRTLESRGSLLESLATTPPSDRHSIWRRLSDAPILGPRPGAPYEIAVK